MAQVSLNAAVYARVFEEHHEGGQILEDLVKRFGQKPYVKGGLDAERETLVRLGRRDVLDFIHSRINQAHGVNDEEVELKTDQ